MKCKLSVPVWDAVVNMKEGGCSLIEDAFLLTRYGGSYRISYGAFRVSVSDATPTDIIVTLFVAFINKLG